MAAAPVSAPSRSRYRDDFPIFRHCAYLNSCSLGALSRQSRERVNEYLDLWERRGASAWYDVWWEALAELRLESLVLNEKVDNALKLIGDLYLARVHALAAQRLYLQDWESAISRKLDIIASLYQLLTDRVRTTQSQTLELIIIALILAEILMAVFFR